MLLQIILVLFKLPAFLVSSLSNQRFFVIFLLQD